jgi:hypothetical protein
MILFINPSFSRMILSWVHSNMQLVMELRLAFPPTKSKRKLNTGYHQENISRAIQSSDVRIVENLEYQSGMFSSVKTGIRNLNTETTGAFFITPVDICLVRPLTVRIDLNDIFKIPQEYAALNVMEADKDDLKMVKINQLP